MGGTPGRTDRGAGRRRAAGGRRRAVLGVRGPLVVSGLAAVLLVAGTTGAVGLPAAGPGAATVAAADPVLPAPPGPQLDRAKVDRALDRLDSYVDTVMKSTGVPGISVAVVYRDEVVYQKGFGVREVGKSAAVDPDTVFQLASVSKPLASTVVAGVAGEKGGPGWDTPVAEELPGFTLKDPWVGSHVTVADLFSHRSGLPDHAGDLLEDLGFDQQYILDHLKEEPLAPFRDSYAYTNFGLTAAAEAVARGRGTSWQALSQEVLFGPAGMEDTSTEYAAFAAATDRAVGHVKGADGAWRPGPVRDADAQAPAGGTSSTARDMARWLRLQLAGGTLDGRRIVPEQQLLDTHRPQITSQPARNLTGRTGFYGLGWNVSYDDQARLRLSHTGAFDLGANSNVTMLPLEQLGIVVLSNGTPVGQADAIALDFFDTAQYGKPRTDWLPVTAALYAQAEDEHPDARFDRPPASPAPAGPDTDYTGTYRSAFYGPLTVRSGPEGLTLFLGPEPMRFPLRHFDGNTFSMETRGENAVGRTAVEFGDGTVRIEYLDETGLGTFTKASSDPSAEPSGTARPTGTATGGPSGTPTGPSDSGAPSPSGE
ncbi:serine hydrolase [Streptomyces sp. NPDC097619]|uniref:serine hydrolase n=1 Tax=Streptomyces sp. NPDC097619 TaxID=3157228 RepID=UPI0033237371